MQKTSRAYYNDSYLTQMESRVVTVSEDGLRVTLDKTHFYPTSGGQPNDIGTLNGIAVVDVIDEDDGIAHVLATPLTDTKVKGEISWPRRYDHMQQHTGQHLLSAVFEELFHMPTLSFRMGEQDSSIELGTKELTSKQIDAATLRATELARTNPVTLITFEDAAEVKGLRKASERQGLLRVIELPGIDRSACGGTHVASLAEVLPLRICGMDKVRGNIRISFVCGNRAITRTDRDLQMLADEVSELKQALSDSEKQRQKLEIETAMRAGLDLYAQTTVAKDGMRRVISPLLVIDENARAKAKAFGAQPKALLLMHSPDSVLLTCSPDSGLNAGALLKQALSKYGARGGGTATLAQGSLPDKAMLIDLEKSISED